MILYSYIYYSTEMRKNLGGGVVIFEFVVDDVKITIKWFEDGVEGFTVGALNILADEGEEQGNLELDLADVDAIKDAVELGVGECGIEFGYDAVFFVEKFGRECAIHASSGVIVGEVVSASGESARE